jgi:hypothetical protein
VTYLIIYRSPASASFVEEEAETGADSAVTRLREKMSHAQPVLRSRIAAVRGSRIKIATDVADMLRSSEAKVRTSRSFSLAEVEINSRAWDLVQLRARSAWAGSWCQALAVSQFLPGLAYTNDDRFVQSY